ncbi:MAG: cell division protein FtsZ, partial [Candidatus Diapherotrites archaeon CG_4_10_14_0_2_um_filter_31_5]
MKSLMGDILNNNSKPNNKNENEEFSAPRIMVIGAGGAGCNTVNRISNMGVAGAQLVAVNTDKQHLSIINDELTKILIGKSVTRGLGAGGYPEIGRKSAEVSRKA